MVESPARARPSGTVNSPPCKTEETDLPHQHEGESDGTVAKKAKSYEEGQGNCSFGEEIRTVSHVSNTTSRKCKCLSFLVHSSLYISSTTYILHDNVTSLPMLSHQERISSSHFKRILSEKRVIVISVSVGYLHQYCWVS